jgi:RNA-binding protein
MKFLGNISHLANSGKLIVKTTKTPPAGAFVFTNDKQKIGKVYSIFGPVKNPYVSVNIFRSVNRRDLESRHGEKLFVSTKSEMEKLNKRNKGKNSKKNSKSNSKRSKSRKSNSKRRRNNK